MISRRSLISGSVAASALAFLPPDLMQVHAEPLFLESAHVGSIFWGGVTDQQNIAFPLKIQTDTLAVAHEALIKLFEGKTILDLQPEADRLNGPPAQRLNITLRTSGRIRGSMSAPGTNLGRQTVQSLFIQPWTPAMVVLSAGGKFPEQLLRYGYRRVPQRFFEMTVPGRAAFSSVWSGSLGRASGLWGGCTLCRKVIVSQMEGRNTGFVFLNE